MPALGVCRAKAAFYQWVQIPPGYCSSREATGATVEVTKRLKPPVKRATNWWQRECAGRNVSER
jgi:hypothetical protein